MDITFSMILEKTCDLLHCSPIQIVRNGKYTAGLQPPEENDVYPWDGTHITRAALYKRSAGGTASALYICDALPAAREANLFCTAQSGLSESNALLPDCEAKWPAANIAWFPSHISRARLLHAAMEAISFYQSWGNTILDMIYREQGLDAIVAYAYPAFQNPFLIYDSSLKVLSYTKNDGSTDPLWTETVRQGTVTDLNQEAARELLLYLEKLDKYNHLFKHQSRDLTDPFFSCNIQISGKRAGMIALMERNHAVTPGQLDLLRMFAYLLTFELQKDAIRRENTGLIYNQLILELMEGTITNPDALHSRLTAARWHIGRYIRTAWLVCASPFLSEPEWRRIFDQLLYQGLDGRGILLENSVFFLLSSKSSVLEKDALATLERFCGKYALRCGLSDPYTNILETHRMKNQSQLALQLSPDTVVCFSQVRYQNLLAHCLRYPEPREILHPAIFLLARHDAKHQTEYLDTLSALFKCQYNQLSAARLLNIHRTTLHYRLQKIAELAKIQFDDTEEMLYLQLSLTLYHRQTAAKPLKD